MKKFLYFIITAVFAVGCTEAFDDSKLWDAINDHENRITKLEELCKQLNTNISALQTIVSALEKNDYITNVSPVQKDGKVIGYTITFAKSGTITIYNGEDGKDGQNGIDGTSPIIGVKQDSDNTYYWTLNGEWLLDANGNKIKAQGSDGEDGTDGEDGITPRLKIENGYWYISYDEGKSWEQLGKAKGEDGADGSDGDSFFKSVTQDKDYVYFELADGTIIAARYSMPAYAINLSETSLDFTGTAGETTIDILTQAQWEITIPEEAQSWVTINPMQGNGDATITISVTDTAYLSRATIIVCSSIHPEYGVRDTKKLTIIQSANVIYSDNFDKVKAEKGEFWPYFDASYANPKGSAAEGVSYEVSDKNITVRSNSESNGNYSDYEGSGVNNIFFDKAPNHFTIEDIKLPADKDCYVLTFGSEKYVNEGDSEFKYNEFHVYISGDNAKWSEVEYAFEEGDNISGTWNDAKASFKLASVPEKLSIKFVADVASAYRLDDVTLYTGGEGAQAIDLSKGAEMGGDEPGDEPSQPGETQELTVTEAISAAKDAAVKIKESTVVAVSARSYLLTDGTSYILAYKGDDPGLAVGDKVTVEGKMGAYRNVPQIANPVATKTGHDDAFKQPEATVMDGAAADAFLTETYIKYVKVEGNLVKSSIYWDFAIEGASTAQGSISYPTAEMCPDSYNGKKVAVYGYTIYQTRDTEVHIIATSIEVTGEGGGDEPSEPSEPGDEPGDEPADGNGTTVSKVMEECGWANNTAVTKLVMDENITVTFEKGSANNAPAYYDTGKAVRLYQNGAVMNVIASNGKVIKGIELTFAKAGEIVQNFLGAAEGDLTINDTKGSWVGEASSVKFTSTGTDKNSRAYISAIKVIYE